uniref:Uncharacterized protein n=1 Tax=Ursus americanus TaxID=9643 RepID=A0A452R4U3_URSAM
MQLSALSNSRTFLSCHEETPHLVVVTLLCFLLSHLCIEDFGASDFATTNAFGVDKTWSRASECIAAVWCDVSGGLCSRVHHSARWLGMSYYVFFFLIFKKRLSFSLWLFLATGLI